MDIHIGNFQEVLQEKFKNKEVSVSPDPDWELNWNDYEDWYAGFEDQIADFEPGWSTKEDPKAKPLSGSPVPVQ